MIRRPPSISSLLRSTADLLTRAGLTCRTGSPVCFDDGDREAGQQVCGWGLRRKAGPFDARHHRGVHDCDRPPAEMAAESVPTVAIVPVEVSQHEDAVRPQDASNL